MTDGPDNHGYRSVSERAQGMGRRKTETVTVHCLLTLYTGDDDAIARLRSQATAVMRVLADRLRTDDVVERPWQRVAVLGDADWVPLLHDAGSTVNVLFDIEAACLLQASYPRPSSVLCFSTLPRLRARSRTAPRGLCPTPVPWCSGLRST